MFEFLFILAWFFWQVFVPKSAARSHAIPTGGFRLVIENKHEYLTVAPNVGQALSGYQIFVYFTYFNLIFIVLVETEEQKNSIAT